MILQQITPSRGRIIVTAGVFCLLSILLTCLPASVFALLFCRGPALFASLYLGATCEGTTLALRSGHSLSVTHACGGSDFFILVCSMIAWYAAVPNKAIRQSRTKAIFETMGKCLVFILATWFFVIVVNSMRVVLSYWTRMLSEALLPERFHAAVHLVSGVMIFFPALLCVWWFCKIRMKEVSHERKNR